ncbi:MAG TPA: beta-mannanase [Aliiroseovarius sp.]|nr:beta-mannanase [Aliiroseovarius sp.]
MEGFDAMTGTRPKPQTSAHLSRRVFALSSWIVALGLVLSLAQPIPAADHASAVAALTPPAGRFLHGTFPGGYTGEEDDITLAQVKDYERAVGRPVSYVYFSHNWFHGRAFPTATARWIIGHGATPYVRLMMRTDSEEYKPEPLYTLARIAAGNFDSDLAAWGRKAAALGVPVLAEFGTEMNGEWFRWNGRWNGGAKGPALFAKAYRHIIDVTRAAGADNLVWVFHVNHGDAPEIGWNMLERYYPGDDYIDWLAVSLYSAQDPQETWRTSFPGAFTKVYRRLTALAPGKPVVLAEFGTDVHNPREPAAPWADQALGQILSHRWPQLIGFSWWNETWENDDFPAHNTDMRVTSDPALAAVFRKHLAHAPLYRP